MEPSQLIIIVLSGLAFVIIILFLAWLLYNKSRNQERMLLIEKGVIPADLDISQKNWQNFPWKKIGLTVIGFGVGVLLMEFLSASQDLPAWYGLPLIFGGFGMILAHRSDRSKKSNG